MVGNYIGSGPYILDNIAPRNEHKIYKYTAKKELL